MHEYHNIFLMYLFIFGGTFAAGYLVICIMASILGRFVLSPKTRKPVNECHRCKKPSEGGLLCNACFLVFVTKAAGVVNDSPPKMSRIKNGFIPNKPPPSTPLPPARLTCIEPAKIKIVSAKDPKHEERFAIFLREAFKGKPPDMPFTYYFDELDNAIKDWFNKENEDADALGKHGKGQEGCGDKTPERDDSQSSGVV